MLRAILIALLCLAALPAHARIFANQAAGAGGSNSSYTDFCATTGLTGNCVYAYSVTHRLNSTSTTPFTLTAPDSATYNAAYTGPSFYVDVAAEESFCIAHGATTTVTTNYTTYNGCNFTEVYDQVGGCHLTPPQANKVFPFRIWAADGYPILLNPNARVGASVGTTVPWLHAAGCASLAGGVKKSIITYTSNITPSSCCGEVGLMENGVGNPPAVPITAVLGAMYAESNYNGDSVPPNVLMATIDCEGACGTSGVTVAGAPPVIPGVSVGTFSGTAANGGTNKFNTFWNNANGDVNVTPLQTINTQSRMSIGCDGDATGCGNTAVRDMILTSTDVSATGGLPSAIYTYLTNVYAGLNPAPSNLLPLMGSP